MELNVPMKLHERV